MSLSQAQMWDVIHPISLEEKPHFKSQTSYVYFENVKKKKRKVYTKNTTHIYIQKRSSYVCWRRNGRDGGEAKGRLRRMRKRTRRGNGSGASCSTCSSTRATTTVYSSSSSATIATSIMLAISLQTTFKFNTIYIHIHIHIYVDLICSNWIRIGVVLKQEEQTTGFKQRAVSF